MEAADPTKRKRGRPSTKQVEEVKVESIEDNTTIEIINTNDEEIAEETVEESAEVLEERRKKVKKAIEDKEEKTKSSKMDCKDTKKETTNEDTNMKTNNTISWQDIAGFEVENIKEDTLPTIKSKDKITVDGKTYHVEEVIPNAKTPSLTVLKVSTQESFVLGEIDSHESINEEEEIQPAPGEEGMDAGETVLGEPEEGETEEHEAGETSEEEAEEHEGEPEVGDKVVIDDEKYLVTEVDEEEKEITVEDEDGEEKTFKFDDVDEIEKSEENKEEGENDGIDDEEKEEGEEGMEGEEKEEKEEVAESYDPMGDSIHFDISTAKRIFEAGLDHSEGMPAIPATANAKGGVALKHTMPQAQGAPKMTNGPVTKGSSVTTHNMPQAQGDPKTTGVGVREMEKKNTTIEIAGDDPSKTFIKGMRESYISRANNFLTE